jgi:hypothetical protein
MGLAIVHPVRLRFHIDADSGLPHIYGHDVNEQEVADVLRKPLEEFYGRKGSVVAHGQSKAGRYLKVIYAPDDESDGIFVITAYDLSPRQLHALRRRLRRKPR